MHTYVWYVQVIWSELPRFFSLRFTIYYLGSMLFRGQYANILILKPIRYDNNIFFYIIMSLSKETKTVFILLVKYAYRFSFTISIFLFVSCTLHRIFSIAFSFNLRHFQMPHNVRLDPNKSKYRTFQSTQPL